MRFQEWEIGGFDRDTAVELCRNGINPLIAVLLTARGITRMEDTYSYLNDDISAVADPFLLADMDKAVARINMAVQRGERCAVYGDYDVDGMTASALLADYLRSKNVEFEIYIPGRLCEGYGLNRNAIDTLKERGVSLIVTVDCGITAISEAAYAKEIGIDLIITDHHECRDELPDAIAVIDPKRQDCAYPNKALAGVGVCFKLVCALCSGEDTEELLRRYGALAALGTVADVMPAVGENRAIIRRGLSVMNTSPRPGLRSLVRDASPPGKRLNAAAVGFSLAPRLNAAGRMGKTEVSISLLLTEDSDEAERLTNELSRLNFERRQLEMEIFNEAVEMIENAKPASAKNTEDSQRIRMDSPIVLAKQGWHQGVMGIVAARIAERHFLPAIMISLDEDGVGRGSCRSFGRFGLYGALQSCEDILESYGGHEMAAGITIVEQNIDELRRRVGEYYRLNIEHMPKPKLKLDFEVEKPELLTVQNVEALERLEPFGNQNMPPALCITGALLVSVVSVGAGKHSRIKIEKSGKTLDGIFFWAKAEELGVSAGTRIDIAFEPQINEFRGKSSVQLNVFDVRAAQ